MDKIAGVITLFAGTGVSGYRATVRTGGQRGSGSATNALSPPSHTAVDIFGNVFIADTLNNRSHVKARADYHGRVERIAELLLAMEEPPSTPARFRPQAVSPLIGNLFVATATNTFWRGRQAGPALAIPTLGVLEAGNYDVVVTGPFVSVTSSVAVLIKAARRRSSRSR